MNLDPAVLLAVANALGLNVTADDLPDLREDEDLVKLATIVDAVIQRTGFFPETPDEMMTAIQGIGRMIERYRGHSTQDLKQQLKNAVRDFKAAGGRGIELADFIDELRIAIGAREVGFDPTGPWWTVTERKRWRPKRP